MDLFSIPGKFPEILPDYKGVAFIGDPHLEARQPGFRKDNYSETILRKLDWILATCRGQNWLPVFLGDFFERPRDNPNRLIVRLMDLLSLQDAVAIYGNHDCSEPILTDDDSLSVLLRGSRLQLISAARMAAIRIGSKVVLIGGSSYREPLPSSFQLPAGVRDGFVCWVTHHDLVDSESLPAKIGVRPKEIPGVDAVINGHLHRQQEERVFEGTRWFVPGNISRRSRHEATTTQRPQFLLLTSYMGGMTFETMEVPHEPADLVFHEQIFEAAQCENSESTFVRGLASLESIRTESGAGLVEFLKLNRQNFTPEVNDYIEGLRQEVMGNVN
jgi:predicted phosphodiesterase